MKTSILVVLLCICPFSSASAGRDYRFYTVDAADRYNLPPAFVLAVIHAESNFNARAVSGAGLRGVVEVNKAGVRK
jgi:soluble lytic murein transglycosylase-like protein